MTCTSREMFPLRFSLPQSLWCSIVERLEHLVLSVYCVPSYSQFMSPKDKKCKLID